MNSDRIVGPDGFLIPDRGVDFVNREDLTRILYEKQEDVVLNRCEFHLLSVNAYFFCVIVDDESAGTVDSVALLGLVHVSKLCIATELGLHTRYELQRIKGLRDVVIRTDIKTENLVLVFTFCTQDNDGNRAVFPNL